MRKRRHGTTGVWPYYALLPVGLRLSTGCNWLLFRTVFQRLSYPFLKVFKTLLFGCLLFFSLSKVLTKTFPLLTKSKGFLQGLELRALVSDGTRHGTPSTSPYNIIFHISSAWYSIVMHYMCVLISAQSEGKRLPLQNTLSENTTCWDKRQQNTLERTE